MTVMSVPILSFLIYFPLLGAVILLFANRRNAQFIKVFTLVISLIEFAVSIPLVFKFDDAAKTKQFVEKADWFPDVASATIWALDGISLLLVL
jgi:NADH-quinone oxidoreductase subunit M